MEASEKIVQAYLRIVKKCFTIPNIKLRMNKEIDCLAIDPANTRYHVEATISTSSLYSRLHDKPKNRCKKKPIWRRSIYFFNEEKFCHSYVLAALKGYGFKRRKYKKIIVSWGVKNGVEKKAKKMGIEIWLLPKMMEELLEQTDSSLYLSDEARIFQLVNLWMKTSGQDKKNQKIDKKKRIWVPKRKGTIGKYVHTLLERNPNITFASMSRKVLSRYPKSRFNKNHFNWYKNMFQHTIRVEG